MLPSSGYFRNLICPYYLNDNCSRVYCHFKHKKPDQIINYVPTPVHLLKDKKTESSVPEYRPTPIDQLKATDLDRKSIRINDEESTKQISQQTSRQVTKKVTYSSNQKDCVYKSIEQKLSTIFDSGSSADEDASNETFKNDNEKNSSKATDQTHKSDKKNDQFSYIEELDMITKETKIKRDLQDKEIVNKIKQKKKKTDAFVISESEQKTNPISKKARIAHKTGDNVNPTINVQLIKKSTRMSPAQVMVNRFSKTSQEESKIESNSKKRIAHIPAISSSSSSNADSTSKQSSKRPVLPLELGSKVPNTIRQRYLNLIIDEYLKINQETEEAYQKALTEEKNVFKRSPSKNTYINLAVNAIRRIRNSAKS